MNEQTYMTLPDLHIKNFRKAALSVMHGNLKHPCSYFFYLNIFYFVTVISKVRARSIVVLTYRS